MAIVGSVIVTTFFVLFYLKSIQESDKGPTVFLVLMADDWLDGCEGLISKAGNHPETHGAAVLPYFQRIKPNNKQSNRIFPIFIL